MPDDSLRLADLRREYARSTLDEASVIGLIIAAVVVFVSFVVGGFAAGR